MDEWALQRGVGIALLVLAGYITYRNVDEITDWLREAQRRIERRLSLPSEFKWILVVLLIVMGLALVFLV